MFIRHFSLSLILMDSLYNISKSLTNIFPTLPNKALEEAEMLRSATVHWLRHTGISDDVKHRPREHVRDDARHSSNSITDRYIDVELQARAKNSQRKTLVVKLENKKMFFIEINKLQEYF